MKALASQRRCLGSSEWLLLRYVPKSHVLAQNLSQLHDNMAVLAICEQK